MSDNQKEDIKFEDLQMCIEIPPDMSREAQMIAFEENPENARTNDNSNERLALITGKRWRPSRTLRVRFLGGDPVVQTKVAQIAKQWTQYANIKIVFGNDPDAEIRISFQPGGSWSSLGTDALRKPKNQPTMNYGWLKPNSSEKDYLRVVLHEFGHALGCIHEHQHPKAGIPWNRDAVYRYYMGPPNNWDKQRIHHNLFRRLSTDTTQFSQYDRGSIMHYSISNELTDGNFEIPLNSQLSEMDKKFIARAYPGNSEVSNKVTIYLHHSYQGKSFELGLGKHDIGRLPSWNDNLSSLKIPRGLRVILYEHSAFRGRSKEFTGDTPYVGDDFNDLTSSIEVLAV